MRRRETLFANIFGGLIIIVGLMAFLVFVTNNGSLPVPNSSVIDVDAVLDVELDSTPVGVDVDRLNFIGGATVVPDGGDGASVNIVGGGGPTATPAPTATPQTVVDDNVRQITLSANDGFSAENDHFIVNCFGACETAADTSAGSMQDKIKLQPFYSEQAGTISSFQFYISTAGAAGEDARFGIWDDSGDFFPGDLAYDDGPFVVDATGKTTVTLGTPFVMSANVWYWIGIVTESATVRFRAVHDKQIPNLGHNPGLDTNRYVNSYEDPFTCGAGCSNSLPDPAVPTGASLSTGSPAMWIALEIN